MAPDSREVVNAGTGIERGVDDYFVGRAAEFAALDSMLRSAAAGRSQVAVVCGPAWIGKTALIKQFPSGSRAGRCGSCGPRATRTRARSPAACSSSSGQHASSPIRIRWGRARRSSPGSGAWQGPSVLVVDDAQWGDNLSLRALTYVSRCDAELGLAAPAASPALAMPARAGGPATAASRVPLTARQLAVARAIAAGKSNEQTARDLYITIKTVEYHVSQIFTRLRIDARADIAAALPPPNS